MIDEKIFSGFFIDATEPMQLEIAHNLTQLNEDFIDEYYSIKEEDLDWCKKCYSAAHSFYFDSATDTQKVTNYAIIRANYEEFSVGLTFDLLKSINVSVSLATFLIYNDYYLTIEKDKGNVTIFLYEIKNGISCDWILQFDEENWSELIKFITLLAESKTNTINLQFKSKQNTTKIVPTLSIKEEDKKDIKLDLYDFYVYFLTIIEKNYEQPFFNEEFYGKLNLKPKLLMQLEKFLMIENINFMVNYMINTLVTQVIFSDFQKEIPYSKLTEYKNKSKYSIFYNTKYISKYYLQ